MPLGLCFQRNHGAQRMHSEKKFQVPKTTTLRLDLAFSVIVFLPAAASTTNLP